MKISNSRIAFSLIVGIISFLPQPAWTQSVNSPNPNNPSYQPNEYGSGSMGANGAGFDPFQLIHRANLSNSRNMEEFNQDSQTNIQNAAENFKRQQQEMLLNQQSESSTDTTVDK